jgi:hypothetical protein
MSGSTMTIHGDRSWRTWIMNRPSKTLGSKLVACSSIALSATSVTPRGSATGHSRSRRCCSRRRLWLEGSAWPPTQLGGDRGCPCGIDSIPESCPLHSFIMPPPQQNEPLQPSDERASVEKSIGNRYSLVCCYSHSSRTVCERSERTSQHPTFWLY